jgi:hypothetical protein
VNNAEWFEDGFFVRPRSKVRGYSNVISIFLASLTHWKPPGVAVLLSVWDANVVAALQNFKRSRAL